MKHIDLYFIPFFVHKTNIGNVKYNISKSITRFVVDNMELNTWFKIPELYIDIKEITPESYSYKQYSFIREDFNKIEGGKNYVEVTIKTR